MTMMIRDTSAQDQPIVQAPWWKRQRKPLLIGLGVVVLLVLIVPTMMRMLSAGGSVSRERLSIATVERGTLVRDIAAEGRVVAAVSPTLYAPAAGSVHFTVNPGHKVAQGDVIGSVDSPELTNKLAQERANLQSMQVDYSRAQLDARQQAIVAEQTLDQAQIDLQTAQTEYERTKQAFDLGVTPEIEVLRTKAALQKAQISLKRAQTDHDLQKEGRHFDVEAKRLARDRQQLLVDDLQRQVDLLTLRSPVDGQIGQLMVVDHTTVAKDAALLSVVDLTKLEVEIKVPESFARDLAVGMPATIRGNGSEWPGEISSVAPEVVNGEVTARARFTGEAPQGLRQSQRLSVRVVLDERKNVLTVARGPFVDVDGGKTAYVVHGDIAEKQPVRLGVASVDKVEILEGLKPGDEVVIAGSDLFHDADRVALSR
nr:HlyD family efflux transporter periplasmic adaptor subunit [Solimonas marina]